MPEEIEVPIEGLQESIKEEAEKPEKSGCSWLLLARPSLPYLPLYVH